MAAATSRPRWLSGGTVLISAGLARVHLACRASIETFNDSGNFTGTSAMKTVMVQIQIQSFGSNICLTRWQLTQGGHFQLSACMASQEKQMKEKRGERSTEF